MKVREIVIPNANNSPDPNWDFINYLDTGNCTKNEIGLIQRIDKGNYPSRAKRVVKKDDVIISTVRPNQRHYAILKDPVENMVVSTGFTVLSAKNDVSPDYLFYFLTQDEITDRLSTIAAGATTSYPSINPEDILDLDINLPNKPDQEKVAVVLAALDDKISINNRINAELEEMARTLYNYWFVQFDFPTSAAQAASAGKPELEGKPYRSSGGEMVWSEELKREVPKGWEVKSLYDIASYTNGLAMQNHRPISDNVLNVIKIREMNEGYSEATEFARGDINSNFVVTPGDILFSWSASLNVMLWADKPGALNQHIFKVTSDTYPRYFVFYQILNYLQSFKVIAENRKTTMGHITKDHLVESRIIVPNDSGLLDRCGITIENLLNLIVSNKLQNQELSQLCDFLLPLLMNGQVRVIKEAY